MRVNRKHARWRWTHGSASGVQYEVDPELAETVTLWFGLYDDQLFVEHGERRYGPYAPSGGPIPLHRAASRKHPPRSAPTHRGIGGAIVGAACCAQRLPDLSSSLSAVEAVKQPFADPDPFHQLMFPPALDAKRAIADHLGCPWPNSRPNSWRPSIPAGCNLGEADGLGLCTASPRSFL